MSEAGGWRIPLDEDGWDGSTGMVGSLTSDRWWEELRQRTLRRKTELKAKNRDQDEHTQGENTHRGKCSDLLEAGRQGHRSHPFQ